MVGSRYKVHDFPNIDFFLEVAKGNIEGHEGIIFRGHNPDQSAASNFVDLTEFGNLVYFIAEHKVRVVSTDANDTDGGDGLRTLLVTGVDFKGRAIEEIVTLDGLTEVETEKSYFRCNFLVGLTVGAAGWNVGTITVAGGPGVDTQLMMEPETSLSRSSSYTVPLGFTLFLIRSELNAAITMGGTTPKIEFRGYARLGGPGFAWRQLFDKQMDTGVTDSLDVTLAVPAVAEERTDIRCRTSTDKNNTETRTRTYGILVNNKKGRLLPT